jgi:hypothetical protein
MFLRTRFSPATSSSIRAPGSCRTPSTPVFSYSAIFFFWSVRAGHPARFPAATQFLFLSYFRSPCSPLNKERTGFIPPLEFFIEVPVPAQGARSWVLLPRRSRVQLLPLFDLVADGVVLVSISRQALSPFHVDSACQSRSLPSLAGVKTDSILVVLRVRIVLLGLWPLATGDFCSLLLQSLSVLPVSANWNSFCHSKLLDCVRKLVLFLSGWIKVLIFLISHCSFMVVSWSHA